LKCAVTEASLEERGIGGAFGKLVQAVTPTKTTKTSSSSDDVLGDAEALLNPRSPPTVSQALRAAEAKKLMQDKLKEAA
jgi:hypothetical protein